MGRYTSGRAALVAFVDVNENGRLDLSPTQVVVHVLSSTDFPTGVLGAQAPSGWLSFEDRCTDVTFGGGARGLPVYDLALLDRVACAREDRVAVLEACGIASQSPVISFDGRRDDDLVSISAGSLRDVTFTLDGATVGDTKSLALSGPELALGQHRLRAQSADGNAWEATFTLPDRTWIKSARPVDGAVYEVTFQEVAGATRYDAIAGGQNGQTAEGTASPLRVEMTDFVSLTARFGLLPFQSSTHRKFAR